MAETANTTNVEVDKITYRNFESEKDLAIIIGLIEKELSEPYPIYTYRYFVQKWPQHTYLAFYEDQCIGCIVSKLDDHQKHGQYEKQKRGYIAMLAVHPDFRRLGLGRKLISKTLDKMKEDGADEIILETEITNLSALRLYESFGFIRDKRLLSYYLNGNDAYKLKLYVK
ncbi:n-acetyltransferase mak3 [Stylonychia lemnae]|uniref:N-acetyltransferase mak3 n=1 Tax=Stylonychia lemnae TaxID=5949 RepID=A0A077ZZZ0_STYLE|nr:n-acetyltransferase mak3 [Stylonychia lemnae]|eukprot:CDW74088.1 n-acetyltransferase mak3 [Stylonychia lemnae]